jgi:hypothetical protein
MRNENNNNLRATVWNKAVLVNNFLLSLRRITKMSRTSLTGVLCASAFVFLVSGSANATTVFAPTDTDVNFYTNNLPVGHLLALFDDSDTSFSSNLGILTGGGFNVPVTGLAAFTAGGVSLGDYTVTSGANSLNLTGSDWFTLAISVDGGQNWSGDIGATYLGNNIYNVDFGDGTVLQVDVTVVPVPAAVWLFGSGLLGLAGVARSKKTA